MATIGNTLSLDVGEKRIGVAFASETTHISQTLPTLLHDEKVISSIAEIVNERQISTVVVGLPRNLSGDETSQTTYVREFTDRLKEQLSVPVQFQDEALTSQKAEEILQQQGKLYEKADIDAMAAVLILNDYIADNTERAVA